MQTQAIALHETEEWAKGERGQDRVSELLKKNGWFLINNADCCGRDGSKAPRLYGLESSYVTPDLLMSKAGWSFWLEIKTKERADFTEITQRLEHGFELRLYRDYLAVQEHTGIKTWVCIVEEDTGAILFIRLNDIAHDCRDYHGPRTKEPMIYFPRDAFRSYDLTALSRISPM